MKRALITGGAGFLGCHLARNLLKKGYSIDLLDNFSRGIRDQELDDLSNTGNVRLVTADLLDSSFVLNDEYDVIFHFAAIIGVANVLQKPFAVLSDNVRMTAKMIELARNQKALNRFVFASTSEVYVGTLQHFSMTIPTPETTPLALTDLSHPRTSYMLSKICGEALCHHSGLPFTIIRPHNIYGPRMGMSHVIPELLKKAYDAKHGDSLPVYSVSHKRTFCYIENAAELISRAVEADGCVNESLNIGTDGPEITIYELAEIILKTVGKDMRVIPQPETPGSPSRRCPDMSKTIRLTRYTPSVSLEEGVMRTFRWYKRHVFDNNGLTAK